MTQANTAHAASVLDFVERVSELQSPDAVIDAFRREAGRYGYSTFALGQLPRAGTNELRPFFVATWPQWWLDIYLGENLVEGDPTVDFARSSVLPAAWSELRDRYPAGNKRTRDALYSALIAHGWPEGLTVPVHGPAGYHGVVSLGGETRDLPLRSRTALHLMALYLHERLRQLLAPDLASPQPKRPTLTRGEIECIQWLIAGKSDWEIGEILNISESAVHWRVERAKRKFGVKTRAQLTALAVHYDYVCP